MTISNFKRYAKIEIWNAYLVLITNRDNQKFRSRFLGRNQREQE
jgi:hypothetical protein